MIQAAAADGVVHLAGAVGGQDHHRQRLRLHRAVLRHADLEVGQQLQQEGFERLVGAVQLVDQQDGGGQVGVDGGEQRAGEQEFAGVDVAGEHVAVGLAGGLGQADRHELAGVVPFIGGGGDVHAVVALQADQAAVEAGGEDLGDLGLAGAGLAFQEQRAAHRQGQVDRGGQVLVGDVALGGEESGGFGDGRGQCGHYRMLPMNSRRMNRYTRPPIQAAIGRPNGARGISEKMLIEADG